MENPTGSAANKRKAIFARKALNTYVSFTWRVAVDIGIILKDENKKSLICKMVLIILQMRDFFNLRAVRAKAKDSLHVMRDAAASYNQAAIRGRLRRLRQQIGVAAKQAKAVARGASVHPVCREEVPC